MKIKYKRILVCCLSMILFMLVPLQSAYAYVGYLPVKCDDCGASGTTYQYCGGGTVTMNEWHEIVAYPGTLCHGHEISGASMLRCDSAAPCRLHTAWKAGSHTEYSNHSSSICYRSFFNRSSCALKDY